MRNIIQAEMYTFSPSHPMRKIMDVIANHRIKSQIFIRENNLKKTYTNYNIKAVQCTHSIPPMAPDYTNRSLTIRAIASESRGKPALSCCKRLCIFIHSNNTPGSLLGWTTLQIFFWMSGILTFVALPQVGVKHIRKI